jgi:hypothetical protein
MESHHQPTYWRLNEQIERTLNEFVFWFHAIQAVAEEDDVECFGNPFRTNTATGLRVAVRNEWGSLDAR